MKFLITGFGPFLRHDSNPSEALAKALAGPERTIVILPTSYKRCNDLLTKTIAQERPDFIISVGLAASRYCPTLEKYAFNEMNSIHSDVDGVVLEGDPVRVGGPARLETSVNLEALSDAMNKKKHLVSLSEDPGRYCCNEAYYIDLFSMVPSLFVHLPLIEKSSLAEDLALVKDIIAFLDN
jgi:pyroglutamyl-peptidase